MPRHRTGEGDHGVACVLHYLTLDDDSEPATFEAYLLDEVLPALDGAGSANGETRVRIAAHRLLQPGPGRRYLLLSDLHDATGGDDPTALRAGADRLRERLAEALASFADAGEPIVLHDVGARRGARVG